MRFHPPSFLLPLLIIAILAFPIPSRAEGPDLTLDDCVKIALEKNNGILAETERVEAAKAGVGKATSLFLPRLDVSETYMRSDNPVMAFGAKLNQGGFTAADFAINRLNNPDAVDNFNLRLQVVQPIFNGGKEWVGLRRAKLGVEASGKGLKRVRQETVYQVAQAYWGVALASEYMGVAKKALEATEGHVKLAKSFFDQGMLVGSELLLAKVRVAEVKESLIKAENRLAYAKDALNVAMGRPQGTPFSPADRLEVRERDLKLDALLDETLKSRPDLAGMGVNVKNLGEGVTLAKTGYLPDVNFIARFEHDTKDIFRGQGDSYTVLGVMSWNVFDGLLTTNSVKEARANYNAGRHDLDRMREGALLETRQAYYNLREARERLEVIAASVGEGEEALRIINRRFEAGMSKTLDVLDAEAALTRARTNRAQALYDYNVGLAALDYAVGRGQE